MAKTWLQSNLPQPSGLLRFHERSGENMWLFILIWYFYYCVECWTKGFGYQGMSVLVCYECCGIKRCYSVWRWSDNKGFIYRCAPTIRLSSSSAPWLLGCTNKFILRRSPFSIGPVLSWVKEVVNLLSNTSFKTFLVFSSLYANCEIGRTIVWID